MAALSIWFPSECSKMAAAVRFDNVLLSDGRTLNLGTVRTNAKRGGRTEGKRWAQRKGGVVVIASERSEIVDRIVMWGEQPSNACVSIGSCISASFTTISPAVHFNSAVAKAGLT